MSDSVLVSLCCVPSPDVTQAVDKVLSLQRPDGSSGVTVQVKRFPFMSVGQQTTLHVCGQGEDGKPKMLRVVNAEPLTQQEVEEGWFRNIAWDYFLGLKDLSHVVFVFQAALDGCSCACPVLFPPLSLEVRKPYEDETTFSESDGTDDWNGWMRGEAASDPRDLTLLKDGETHLLLNRTYTNNSAGIVLKKSYEDLVAGRLYEFGVTVRRSGTGGALPKLSLDSESQNVVVATDISTTTDIEIKGAFTADSSLMELRIVSHVATGGGNDYAFHNIWVRSL